MVAWGLCSGLGNSGDYSVQVVKSNQDGYSTSVVSLAVGTYGLNSVEDLTTLAQDIGRNPEQEIKPKSNG